MQDENPIQARSQKPGGTYRTLVEEAFNPGEEDFAASADEVARRAYFSYLNQGSPSGRDVQHWLEAEAELIVERNRTRVHGFHPHAHSKTHRPPPDGVSIHENSQRQAREDLQEG